MTEREYFVKQKLYGILLLVMTVVLSLITGDGTAAVLLVPISMFLIFTRKHCLYDSDFPEEW